MITHTQHLMLEVSLFKRNRFILSHFWYITFWWISSNLISPFRYSFSIFMIIVVHNLAVIDYVTSCMTLAIDLPVGQDYAFRNYVQLRRLSRWSQIFLFQQLLWWLLIAWTGRCKYSSWVGGKPRTHWYGCPTSQGSNSVLRRGNLSTVWPEYCQMNKVYSLFHLKMKHSRSIRVLKAWLISSWKFN